MSRLIFRSDANNFGFRIENKYIIIYVEIVISFDQNAAV